MNDPSRREGDQREVYCPGTGDSYWERQAEELTAAVQVIIGSTGTSKGGACRGCGHYVSPSESRCPGCGDAGGEHE